MISRSHLVEFSLLLILAGTSAFGEVRRALVIGVSEYPHYVDNPIKYAHIDALRFGKVLESDVANRMKVTYLTNDEATRGGIWDAVDSLKRERPLPDTLFVFFSGHAELDPSTQQLYFMPSDGERNRLSATGILASELITSLKAVGPTNFVLFIDACHSAAALMGKGGRAQEQSVSSDVASVIANLNKGKEGVAMVFASTSANELSWEDEESHQGIFTRFLVRGLEGEADGLGGPKNGQVTAGKLKEFLEQEVPKRARSLGKPMQTPFVSADFSRDYILTLAVPGTAAPSAPSPSVPSLTQIQEARRLNPELALAVHAGAIQSSPHAASAVWSPLETDLRTSFQMARAIKVGTLPVSIKAESLISPVITPDGSSLVACVEPTGLIMISLTSGAVMGPFPIQLPGSTSIRHVILDSCEISVSGDGRLAAVKVRGDTGLSRLSLVRLDGRTEPTLSVSDYESAAFVNVGLVLSKGRNIMLLSTETWTSLSEMQLDLSIASLVGESESNLIGILGERSVKLYAFDADGRSTKVMDHSNLDGVGPCSISGNSLYCNYSGTMLFLRSDGSGSGGSGCGQGDIREFPSGVGPNSRRWSAMFQCTTEPNLLRLFNSSFSSNQVRIPESILTARLLKNDKVVAVGQNAGIYVFDSLQYGDCCGIPIGLMGGSVRIAAGSAETTVVLKAAKQNGELKIFRASQLIKRVTLPETDWVDEIVLSESNRTIVLGGRSKLTLIANASYGNLHIENIDCGLPAAIDATDSLVVCMAADSGKIQLRRIADGLIEREFDEHRGPIHAVAIDGRTVTVAGTYTGRSQTLVTVWNVANGKVVSQRGCQTQGAQSAKRLAFIRRGNYFVQPDTPSRLVTRESLTCEESVPQRTDSGKLALRASVAGASVVVVGRGNSFFTTDAFEQGSLVSWDVDAPIDDLAVSPDGADVVLLTAGRILRIPVTPKGFLEVAKGRVQRELTAQECREFFSRTTCPAIKAMR